MVVEDGQRIAPVRKTFPLVTAVLLCAPILLVLTLIEIWGLLETAADPIYEIGQPRYAMLDRRCHIKLWPANASALNDYQDGYATYAEMELDPVCSWRMGPWNESANGRSGGFIDQAGKKYPLKNWWVCNLTRFSNGLANVIDPYSGKFFFVDRNGFQRLNECFPVACGFSDGLAAVSTVPVKELGLEKESGKFGYIDKTGRFVIPPRFASAERFIGGKANVRTLQEPSRWQVIDRKGNLCGTTPVAEHSEDKLPEETLATFPMERGKEPLSAKSIGFRDKNGKVLQPELGSRIITAAFPFSGEYTVVKTYTYKRASD